MSTDIELHDEQPAMPEKSPEARRWNDLYNLARLVANTDMAPRNLRGRIDAVFAVFAYADEVGIKPMTALREVAFIEGIPRPSAMMQRALILRAGHVLEWRKVTDTEAVLYGRRRDDGRELLLSWTQARAVKAKLWGKANWTTYPAAMLAARVTSELGRLLFADVLLGMEYTAEEVGQVGPTSAIDIDYTPGDDDVPIVDDDDHEDISIWPAEDDPEERPAHVVQAEILDAEDAMDAEWIAEARGDG